MAEAASDQVPEPERVIGVVNAVLAADGPEKRRLIETESDILLHPAAEEVLRNASERAAERGDHNDSKAHKWHADLLAACRTHGVDATFADERWVSPSGLSNEVSAALDALRDAVKADDASSNPETLRRKDTICRYILGALSRSTHGALWTAVSFIHGDTLQDLGDLTDDISVLRQAEQAYRGGLTDNP